MLTGMKRYIVFIANIKDGKPSVNCFLFEVQNGKRLPVEGRFEVLDGDSPFRLNSFVMENVLNGAESLNDTDKVCKPADEISGQDENEISQTPKADIRNPENGLSITPKIDDKHVSAGKEIDDNGRENKKNTEIDDHDHQNTTNMISTTEKQQEVKVDNLSAVTEKENATNSEVSITKPKSSNHLTHPSNEVSDIHHTTNTNNKQNNNNKSNIITNNDKNKNKSEVEHCLQKSNTRTKLHKTPQPGGKFAFPTSSSQKSPTSPSEEQQESKVNDPPAESVHKEGNDPEAEEVSTGQPRSSNDCSDPQHTTITNGEEKEPTSLSQDPQELKVNDQPAESVDEGKNDPGSEKTLTEQSKPPDHHSDPQPTNTANGEEKMQTSPSEEHQKSKVNDTHHTNNKQNNNNNNSNIITNNDKNNNKSETEHHLQKSNTRTKLVSTRGPDGEFVFNTSSNEQEKSPTSPSEKHQELKVEEEEITGQSKSQDHHSDPQQTNTANGEEKMQTSPSEEHQKSKVNDQPAESVHEGKNDPGSGKTITGQPNPPDHHSDPQQTNTTNGEEKSQTSGNDPPAEVRGCGFCRIFCC